MKPLLFIGYTTASIYASLRWEWVAWVIGSAFLFGAAFVVFYALYRHLASNRLI